MYWVHLRTYNDIPVCIQCFYYKLLYTSMYMVTVEYDIMNTY
jgi:hypothetical protein